MRAGDDRERPVAPQTGPDRTGPQAPFGYSKPDDGQHAPATTSPCNYSMYRNDHQGASSRRMPLGAMDFRPVRRIDCLAAIAGRRIDARTTIRKMSDDETDRSAG